MSISIVLRTDGSQNIFRDIIIGSIGSGVLDEAILCSGFFQENFKGSAYKVSDEAMLANVCARSGVTLTTVGVHNPTWRKSYENFKRNMVSSGVKIKCKYKGGTRWHAKVFIGSRKGEPLIGIIGSSNMTRNAFSTGAIFNNECDVFMWNSRSLISKTVRLFEDRLEPSILIRAKYVARLNENRSIGQMLRRIQEEVLGGDFIEI